MLVDLLHKTFRGDGGYRRVRWLLERGRKNGEGGRREGRGKV